MTEPTEVGSIVAYLRMDASDWRHTLDAAEAEARRLGQANPTVRIGVDGAPAAIAQLAAVDEGVKHVDQSAKNAGGHSGGMSKLLTAAILLGPALIPVLAVAAAMAGAFGLLGAAGALALLGINKEIKAGTPLGQQYAQTISILKANLAGLEHSAASGFLGPFNAAVARSQALMPGLNSQIHDFAAITGDIGGHILGGLIGGFHTLNPLLAQLAILGDRGAVAFDRYTNGGGLQKFSNFVQANLPSVVATIDSIAHALGHVAASAGPLGGATLTVLKALADVIDSLPSGAITALVTGFVLLRVAALGLGVLKTVADNLETVRLRALKMGAGGTGLAGGLGLAAGGATVLGGALFGLTTIMSESAARQQRITELTEAYRKALDDTHGAITQATDDAVLQQAAADGTLKILAKLGISSAQWTDAVEHGGKAYDDLSGKLLKAGGQGNLVRNNLVEQRKAFGDAAQQVKDYTDATTENNKALAKSNPELAKQADSLGLTITALLGAQDAAKKKQASDLTAAAAQKVLIDQDYQLAGTQDMLAKTFGITTQQVQSYAAMVGITQEQVAAGAVSGATYTAAVQSVADAYNNATASGSEFLGSLATFAQSAGTAADRAALIGATLKAANGDALAYGSAISSATAANDALTGAFGDQAAAIEQAARQVASAQAAAAQAQQAAAQNVASAVEQEQAAERSLTQAQVSATQAQKALTQARVDAKRAVEDLKNQVIDGHLAERRAILDLQAARRALAKNPTSPDAKLALDEAKQRLAEIQLENRRLAAESAASKKAGIEGSAQVVSAQDAVKQSAQGVLDAQRALAKAQAGIAQAQVDAAQQVAAAQAGVSDALRGQAGLFEASERAAINAKTGLIDYSKKGAAPLVAQLQAIQDAAVKAAAAQYQHELNTKGATKAADDAYKTYVAQTRGQLIDEATQLGLTKAQAKKLADEYFGLADAPNIKKTIKSEGADKLATVLDKIGRLLADLTDKPWDVEVNLKYLQSLAKGHGKLVDAGANAAGTSDWRGGPTWVGEQGPELLYLPQHSQIVPNNKAKVGAFGAAGGVGSGGVTINQTINNPIREPASVSAVQSLRRAAFTLGGF